jgi:outer membrane protein OmpA-like peptidoglycan-associated protein
MKSTLPLSLAAAFLIALPVSSSAQGVFDRVKNAAKDKANQQVDDTTNSTIDSAIDKGKSAAKSGKTSSGNSSSNSTGDSSGAQPATDAAASSDTPAAASIKSYQNYDFIPGDVILFADDFTTTQDGEFPEQWELMKGQGVVNKQAGYEAMLLTDGNYAEVSPRVKNKSYLGTQFTIEYDTFATSGAYPLQVFLQEGDNTAEIAVGSGEASYNTDAVNLSGNLPESLGGDNYFGHWHHVAIAVKNHQLKIYCDQYRVLTVPDMKRTPSSLYVGGIGNQENPIIFRNVRVASGGGMNLVGQKFTEAKIVTHGINFDVDKATLRPESMGTLNQIKRVLADNPDLKFEIDGHTDNSGGSGHNLTLSQQRAEAVKAQLVQMGVAPSRLTTKGYGDTKPMADNGTPEGKANNRRVEFVRVS